MKNSNSKTGNSPGQEPRLSRAMENYLLSIFRLEEQEVRATPTRISEYLKTLPVDEGLGTTLPSVGGMIRRMVRERLVETTPNKDVLLTEKGRKSAETIVRRHRLAERMVVDLLGVDPHKAHIEAHRLEHAISPQLEQKIAARLGNPTACPFGHPIPGSNYVAYTRSMTLEKAKPGQILVLDRVPEDDDALLEYLVANGLLPGQTLEVKESAESRGVITISCNGNDLVFSYEVASRIRVSPDIGEDRR